MTTSIVMPEMLRKIMEWERRIAPEVPYLENPSGYFWEFDMRENGGYRCSPLDSIVFARAGVDGIHYSLLTDFGANTDLDEAPVICVSPMDFGHSIRLVARNLRDFFILSLSGHGGLLLNNFQTKEAYMQFLEREEQREGTEYFDLKLWRQQSRWVWEQAMKEFGWHPIEDAFDYMVAVRAERGGKVILPTADGLGIVQLAGGEHVGAYTPHLWQGEDLEELSLELEEIQAFVEEAEPGALLSFIRDCQAQNQGDYDLIHLLSAALRRHGFQLEAERLVSCMRA